MPRLDSEPFPRRLSGGDAYGLSEGTWARRAERLSRIELPGAATAAGIARRHIETHLGGVASAQRLDDIRLLVSEVVTNAVLHGDTSSGIVFLFAVSDDRVRVEVRDGGAGFDAAERPSGRRLGYGLRLVDRMATCWGIGADKGTCVWFELAFP
jgi:anti-sigma regulatory factor (Ser/Thr protein kinase)